MRISRRYNLSRDLFFLPSTTFMLLLFTRREASQPVNDLPGWVAGERADSSMAYTVDSQERDRAGTMLVTVET